PLWRCRVAVLIVAARGLGVDVDDDGVLVLKELIRRIESERAHQHSPQKSVRRIVPTTMPPVTCWRSCVALRRRSSDVARVAATEPRLHCESRCGSPAMMSSAAAAASLG